MKDIMKEVEGKVKFSMVDSTMMLLVQQAMDKAHEKIKTKHGLLLRLNAISLFYELAVLQLESCLQLVQQETGQLESTHEEVVRDLRVIKDRLHHRLLETELAILEKDRELLEMSKNQESLRNVLESKESELVHLQDLERKRRNFLKEDEFSELKSSVDQQVMNLRQKLETEYDELRGETEDDPSGVDIDVLKGTMDLAFNKMHHAIFLSELGPIEQSWRWSIERDSMALLLKGFMNGLEEKKKKVMMVVRDYGSGFRDRVCSIRREVECLESQIDQIIIHRSCVATSSSSIDCDDKEEEVEAEKEEEEEVDSSNLPVSKLIKSHESIIRRKSEEVAPIKIEAVKRQKSGNSSGSKRVIDDIVVGLDSLMSLNTNLFQHLFDDDDDDRYAHDEKEVGMDDNLDDVWMKMQKRRSVFSDNVIEEKEESEIQLMILEDTYLTLLKGLLKDEILNNRGVKEEEIDSGHKCVNCLEKMNLEKEYEILGEDEKFRQEVDWIIVTELVREVSEHVENQERSEAHNKRVIEEERNRAFLEICLLYDDFDFKIQEKLKMVTLRLNNLEMKIRSTKDCVAELSRKESVYRTTEIINNRKEEGGDIESEKIDAKLKCRACLENLNMEKDYEILREDEGFRQELDWIIVTEFLRGVSETVKNHEMNEANNKRMIEEEGNIAFLGISLLYDDFDFRIQEKLKMVTFRLQNLEMKIHLTMVCVAELRRKESVYRTAFVLRSENLIKAEAEVDLLGDQVDSLVKLLKKTLWTLHQHPLVLSNNSDISEISKMIKKELSYADS